MQDSVTERATEYHELHTELNSKRERLSELRAETFSTESEETETKAREFFANVGLEQEISTTKQIDELEEEIDELEFDYESTRDALLEALVDVQFPLEQTIETTEKGIRFPYSHELDDGVLDALACVLDTDLDADGVKIDTNGILTETDDVDEAMEMVKRRIERLRSKADTRVDATEYVENIRNRDPKIAKFLYVLYNSDEPLTKTELEEAIGVDDGALRGQLYHVLNNDPYLKKTDQHFSLTETGSKVMEEFESQYGAPDGFSSDETEEQQ